MKGKSAVLRNELASALLSTEQIEAKEVEKLFADLAELSHGDIAVYKHRIQGVLARLTDRTIEVGGDSVSLLQRNSDNNQAIASSTDAEGLKAIVYQEAQHLTALTAEFPVKKVNYSVEQANAYIQKNYNEEIDVNAIAIHLNVSRSYLMRTFKKETEQTINQYLTQFRIFFSKRVVAR